MDVHELDTHTMKCCSHQYTHSSVGVFSQTAEHEHEQEKDEESVFLRKFTSVQEKSLNTFVWRSVQTFFSLNTEHPHETVTTKNTKIVAKLTCGQGVQILLSHVKNVFMMGKLNTT